MDKVDTPFDFKPIVNAHERDTKKSCKITKLNLTSTFPDIWNKMNVSTTKIPFTYKTITEHCYHFGKSL